MKAHQLVLRFIAIAIVAAYVLVPIVMVKGKISERSVRAEGVLTQFAAETSGAQLVAGPFLALGCEESYVEEREVKRGGKAETVAERKVRPCNTAYFSPRTLEASGRLPVEELHRGIYPIRLYRARLRLQGEIAWPAPAPPAGGNPRSWKSAQLVLYVRDARGIREVRASPPDGAGGPRASQARFAIQSHLGEYRAERSGEILPFDIELEFVGTSSLGIAPVGDESRITLASDWPHPSFIGPWAPDRRRVDAGGFEAAWRTTHHATGGQAAWEAAAVEGFQKTPGAGVALLDPVNVYSLSYRATEYGFLFVLFTFGALALAEVVAGVRTHAMQYLLVGTALAVFFLLLLALSEHVAFSHAYAGAATACVALLTFYLRHPLGTLGRTAAFFGLFASMYGALFVLLRSEDHALLMGSLLVFLLLTVVMVATRRLDWSALAGRLAIRANQGDGFVNPSP
jgi:inner membrane protein